MAHGMKMPPVGLEDFEALIKDGFYLVDKTEMIADLLRNRAAVTLFTRPRRFGKTLNMSMLKCFFEIGMDPSLFDGLAIARENELCERHMGKYPVVSVSLKSVDADSFTRAKEKIGGVIAEEAGRLGFLEKSERLDDRDKESFRELLHYSMAEQPMTDSLRTLCRLLEKHYGQKAILLIDEYDVPLQKAFVGGYYDKMLGLIRGMFSQALKTNPSLKFAVLTGCLRISKESIFTGMNNLCVMTVSEDEFSDCFGFTDSEVRGMLEYYGLNKAYGRIREWYDGYRFGDTDVYCPWSVVSHVKRLRNNPNAIPESYWANSSGNEAVYKFIERLDMDVTEREMEMLAAGETVMKEIRPDLTYREMYDSSENIWSLLYMTGYLTKRGEAVGKMLPLTIPNMEVRSIFTAMIKDIFKKNVMRDNGTMAREFCSALLDGDAQKAEELMGEFLLMTVGIRDTFAQKQLKENFYHGILLGILGCKGGWTVYSNFEAGDGYSDILVEPNEGRTGIIIEVKYAHDGNLEKSAREALQQIDERHYDAALKKMGKTNAFKYGIACYRKECRVELEK